MQSSAVALVMACPGPLKSSLCDLSDSVCDPASPLLEQNKNFQDHGHAIEETIYLSTKAQMLR